MDMGGKQSDKILDWLQEKLRKHSDMVYREVKHGETQVRILYLNSLIDEKSIHEKIIQPLYALGDEQAYRGYVRFLPVSRPLSDDRQTIMNGILFGFAFLMLGSDELFLLDVHHVQNKTIHKATIETVIQGPQNALSEDIAINVGLIRARYRQVSLRFEQETAGKLSQTGIGMLYDENLVNPQVLENVKKAIQGVKVEVLQGAGQLQKHLTKKKRSLFPIMMITERPDRVAFNLSQGKVVMLIQGTPFALIAPSTFYDFFSSMEDIYQSYWIKKSLIVIRYLGLFISVLLPSMYVALTAYNPEVFRVQLALSIAGSRIGVPFPAFVEVLFMLLMMELLTEASVRLPKTIGSTAATVGGLILGQAATEAGLVSNIMIIIVAAVAIANFVIPITAMGFAMRFVKYGIFACTVAFGVIGMILGMTGLIIYLVHLDSFGEPYFKMYYAPTPEEIPRKPKGGD
ncbi:MAG: spore germination protein [Paenibacillaceae bacterium]|uniref:Spore germination protein n=1 Tax=Paenibacillus mellifer TaxID=2937794 RepID=A0A9X1Y5H7_9BACL|nr:spore germination protein [Paenibacillus mellifer]MBW4838187.1 spore germination protein [Paenibacillaceae bacterium]MCK8487687.1 spore germination protein [Paenibacillus mellifer]